MPNRVLSVSEVAAAVMTANRALAHGLINQDQSAVEEAIGARSDESLVRASQLTPARERYLSESADGMDVSISKNAEDGVRAADAGGEQLVVHLPNAAVLKEGVVTSDTRTVVYLGSGQAPAVAVQAASGGVRIHTVMAARGAAASSDYRVALGSGETIVKDPSGFLVIRRASGDARAYVTPAWAVDASGRRVRSSYTVSESIITQHVDLTDPEIQFPVVADPWMGSNLVDKAAWSKSNSGWTLKVTPTGWARSITFVFSLPVSLLAGYAGWDELYARYKNAGLNTNLGGMKDQYVCHLQFAPLKETWNLDEWRPNVSYASTVAQLCNPK